MYFGSTQRMVAIFAVFVAAIGLTTYMIACPFCSAINLTFAEQIKSNDIVVIAKLVKIAEPVDDPELEIPKSQFEITDVIKGDAIVPVGAKFQSLLVGRYPVGDNFLVMGVDPPDVSWSTPMKASNRVVDYLRTIQSLPESGPNRLSFFQKYFEDEESVLAFDAYDEFAAAPYEDVVALKDKMDHDQLVAWIKNPETSTNRRRLYFTMLGVCGGPDDVDLLEEYIRSGDRKKQAGLDALVACYLTLKGEAGLNLIVDTFLKEEQVEYVDTLAAVSALRFHGTEVEVIDRKHIVKAVRTLLDRPKIADMIIPDLARWEDWSVMDRLVQMFKDSNEDTSWLRVPIASYLRSCPKPEAKAYIEELKKIDADSIKRADFFLDFTDENDSDSQDDSDEAASDSQDDNSETSGGGDQELSIPKESYVAQRIPLNLEANLNPSPSVTENGSVSGRSPSNLVATTAPELTPVAQANLPSAPLWQLIIIPFTASVAIFLLLWSIISGWFDRLIY